MKLYGGNPSPFFRKARVFPEEKGIPYQTEMLAPFPKTRDLLALHPMGRVKELLEQAVPPVLDYLESQVPGDRDSVLERFSIADAALGAQLGNLTFAGVEIDATRWPRTARYYRALLARPSFETAMAR